MIPRMRRRISHNKVVRGVQKNAPTILTVTGVVCFGVAIFTAVRETPKYEAFLDKEEPKTTGEKAKIAAKVYWPTAVIAGLGVASLVGANYISSNRQKALSAAYMGATEALQRYQKHISEHLDEETVKKIRQDVAQETIEAHPPTDNDIPQVIDQNSAKPGDNLIRMYDVTANDWFWSNEDKVRAACAMASERLMLENWMTHQDVRDILGLPYVAVAETLGFYTGEADYSEDIPGHCMEIEPVFSACRDVNTGQLYDSWSYRVRPCTDYDEH